MLAKPNGSSGAERPSKTAPRWSWAGGVAAGVASALAVTALVTPAATFLSAPDGRPSEKPIAGLSLRAPAGEARMLEGISGESFADASLGGEREDRAVAELSSHMVTPAALDRLSAGDCMTLTTTSGQKLSFRILGAGPGESSAKLAPGASMELAVTACSLNGEGIAKAVIESKADHPGKQQAVQRNL